MATAPQASKSTAHNAPEPIRILAIDGGGIRGLIPALVLAELERLACRPAREMFDLIAGTSTGAIIALGLTLGGEEHSPMTATEIAEIYKLNGAHIFPAGKVRRATNARLGYQYAPDALRHVAKHHFGDAWLSECEGATLIPTYDLNQRGPRVLSSREALRDENCDFRLVDVVQAACAAPAYFPKASITSRMGSQRDLVDGGIFINNPTMLAVSEAGSGRPRVVVSLGTGDATAPWLDTQLLSVAHPFAAVQTLVAMAMDGSSAAVHEQARSLFGPSYYRFDTQLLKASESLDDATASNLASLEQAASELCENKRKQLTEVVAALGAAIRPAK